MSKNSSGGSHVGSASILLIFAVLSLVSFATLTMASSKADYNLSNKLISRQQEYTKACHQGNAFVAAVNSGYETQTSDGIIRESVPINNNQALDIAIMQKSSKISKNSGNTFKIIQWQIVNISDFEYDATLPVMP